MPNHILTALNGPEPLSHTVFAVLGWGVFVGAMIWGLPR